MICDAVDRLARLNSEEMEKALEAIKEIRPNSWTKRLKITAMDAVDIHKSKPSVEFVKPNFNSYVMSHKLKLENFNNT